MAKFYGKIGYAETTETSPGVWEENIVERYSSGDILSNSRRLVPGQINDNIEMSVRVSILADSYASQNIYAMRYVELAGGLWKVTNVEPQRPRLILTLGGIYNGKQN